MSMHDLIAAILEKLHAAQPDLTTELVELLAHADIFALRKLFGGQDHPASAGSNPTKTELGDGETQRAEPASQSAPTPPTAEGPWDERGFKIGPRSPDRFPRPRFDEGTSGWAA
jgi:hypothetical protein